jgi:DNA-binding NtrC family response regulator/tetratricopeptide (TPR) repeat protein
MGRLARARAYLEAVLRESDGLTYIRFGAFDNMARLALAEGNVADCGKALEQCTRTFNQDRVPSRSWYELDHQQTKALFLACIEDWHGIIENVDEADPVLAQRQFKALRTWLLCAKARAQSRLGRHTQADATLATALRTCPRGAIDPLIALEASKGLCLSLRGDVATGARHFDRALAACRAIGHRYHESWIDRDRRDVTRHLRETVAVARPAIALADSALLLSDVATALGAGHSIELLTQRTVAILSSALAPDRIDVRSEFGCPYQPEPSAAWDTGADGTCRIRLRGSDRRVTIAVRQVHAIDEISLMKSVADLVQAAVNRTIDTQREDDDQNLWPRAVITQSDEPLFQSPRMVELLKVATRLAATHLPVLITGETGTGKEILAGLIHEHSLVKRGPFVPFNCSAIPRELVESQLFGHRRGAFTGAIDASPGVIRAADRGTLFLDELGDLDPAVQPKLLRVLESGEIRPLGDIKPLTVAVRIIAATNVDIDALVEQGRFRRDLFYRVGVARVALPPLRERKDEIPAFASLFLRRVARECGRTGVRLGDDFIAALLLYDWPGNIRQLANEIRRAVAMAGDGDVIGRSALSPEVTRDWDVRPAGPAANRPPTVEVRLDQPLAAAIQDLEQRFIERAMDASGGRVAEAAQLLGLSRKGLFLKRRRRGLIRH